MEVVVCCSGGMYELARGGPPHPFPIWEETRIGFNVGTVTENKRALYCNNSLHQNSELSKRTGVLSPAIDMGAFGVAWPWAGCRT